MKCTPLLARVSLAVALSAAACSDGRGPTGSAGTEDGAGEGSEDGSAEGTNADTATSDTSEGDASLETDSGTEGADTEQKLDTGGGEGSDGAADTFEEDGDIAGPEDGGPDAEQPPEPTPVCVAIRGNGELITAHFAALARIAESYGPFGGVAGGSSASITSFLTESMHMNPVLWECEEGPCTPAQAGARLGLMFKSLYGYIDAMGKSDEALAAAQIMEVIQQAQADGVGDLIAKGQAQQAWDALTSLLSSPDVQSLVNVELLKMVSNSPDLLWHVKDIWDSLMAFGSFSAADTSIFTRPGVVSFEGLAMQAGRFGSFYAGYGDFDKAGWLAFFDNCAEPGVGLLWPQVAAMPAGKVSCGEHFGELLAVWRKSFVAMEDTAPNRLDDEVGKFMRALAITSVVEGSSAASIFGAQEAYQKAAHVPIETSFGDVWAGYWGHKEDIAEVEANPRGYSDLKTSKAKALDPATWRLALSLSPAEPGLARAMALGPKSLSAGGWPDLEPVLALKNAGCQTVIYVTRRGAASNFARGVAQLLGAGAKEDAALYDLSDPASSFSLSLSEADGVFCTDWNAYSGTDVGGLMLDAHNAPLEVRDNGLWLVGPAYPHTTPHANLVGCSPGVVE